MRRRSRAFSSRFHHQEVGQGTGLGLSLVYAIVTDLAGAIDVKSALAQGSTFVLSAAGGKRARS